MNDTLAFEERNRAVVEQMGSSDELRQATKIWFEVASRHEYSYHFSWLGRPIIQFPQDMVAIQEIIWSTRPNLIIETGVARGGSLILNASILHLLGGDGRVLGIDIDIRAHNRDAIEAHPMHSRIDLLEGSSVDDAVLEEVRRSAAAVERVMVILDSNHTHEHVLRELELYSPLVTQGCYLVVMDTVIEDMPSSFSDDRPWDVGDNPKTAVHEFLRTTDRFELDRNIQDKLVITVAPDGYLKCTRD
jgi:cephalosporin hydroxylase